MFAISTWLSTAGPGFVGKLQIYRRWWTFLRGYFMLNGSCLLKWPRTIEVSFWKWNMESQNTHSGITSATIWVHFPHIQNHCQVPAKCRLFLLLFSTVNSPCYSFLPKISWSNWNSGWKITFLEANAVWKAAHRSKRRPEFFPNYLKPHFEGWRRRGLRLHFWTEYGAPFILRGEEEGKTSLLSELIIFPKSRFNSALWFPQKTGSTYMVTWIKLCSCSICYDCCTVWITFLSGGKKKENALES